MTLVEEGRLSIIDPVSAYIPVFAAARSASSTVKSSTPQWRFEPSD
jgi:CubicO group peptidase (beta-lactamase class C family)